MTTPPASLPFRPARLIPLVALPALLTSSPVALAVDGTITINGEITDSTCKINNQTPPSNLIVNLPKISTGALKAKGDFAGATLFTLKLTHCPSTLGGEVKAYFEPGPTTDYDNGALYAYTSTAAVTSAASSIPTGLTKVANVSIQLTNPDGTPIVIGASSNTAAGDELRNGESSTKTATLRYLARYLKSGDGNISSGKLVTYVQYSIVYP